jgi:hypothetical protein
MSFFQPFGIIYLLIARYIFRCPGFGMLCRTFTPNVYLHSDGRQSPRVIRRVLFPVLKLPQVNSDPIIK